MTNEVWKPVVGYEGLYEISNLGRVKSLIRGIIRKQRLNKGYMYIGLHKDGVEKMCKVHRLVAEAFIPNPKNKSDVNHKDQVKTNNKLENLEWATRKENTNYSKEKLKRIKRYKTNTGEHHITFEKRTNAYVFAYQKSYARFRKRFKSLEEAKQYRDETFEKNCLAI